MSENGPSRGRPPHEVSEDEVDYLLSAGSLGASQRERILAALGEPAAARTPDRRPGRVWLRRLTGIAAAATAAAAVALWLHGSSQGDGFRRKGSSVGPATVTVDVTCLQATLRACPRGLLVAFAAHGAPPGQALFVTAYLQKHGEATRTWLLRGEPAGADQVGARGLLLHGARIPDQQPAGEYTVEVLVSRKPGGASSAGPANVPTEDLVMRAKFETVVVP